MLRAKKRWALRLLSLFSSNLYTLHSLIRVKLTNSQSGDQLSGCLVTGKCTKLVCRRNQTAITFSHEEFEDELYVKLKFKLNS